MTRSGGRIVAEHCVEARTCKFDPTELRWIPSAQEAIRVALTRDSTGSVRLALGKEEIVLAEVRTISQLSPCFVVLELQNQGQVGLRCDGEIATKAVVDELIKRKADYERFEQYEQNSVQSYFQYYAKLANQQNMLQDSVRTGTYRRAIIENPSDFHGKSVMDIGAGSGILSFFAAQAGASLVYPVEASSMTSTIQDLADANVAQFPWTVFKVINKPIEKVGDEVEEKVDCLVSEPIGTFLFNERMLESYLCARDRFLKPGGKMFPNVGDLFIAPFSDPMLHWEQEGKNAFWKNKSFYGLDLTPAVNRCTKEHFRQPIVDYINPLCICAEAVKKRFDFATVTIESLHNIEIPFDFEITRPCLIHGIAGWFDAIFQGTDAEVVLSTAPWCPGTHWYQIRFALETPIAANAGQHIEGTLTMEANNLQSYFIKLHLKLNGTDIFQEAPCIDLKDPEYRFYSSTNAYVPPGTPSPTGETAQQSEPAAAIQQYPAQQDAQGATTKHRKSTDSSDAPALRRRLNGNEEMAAAAA